MGSGTSVSIQSAMEQTHEELTELMMPPYYIRNVVVTDIDINVARAAWRQIIDGSSKVFISFKQSLGIETSSCLTWFYDCFYNRLFDVNPSARPLFKTNIQSQGRVLMGIISTALNQLRDPDSFTAMLINLAHVHSQRGVRGMQYGIIGDVLFWTLKHCLGEAYDEKTSHAWIKIFSYMLKIIVPVAVADEILEIKAFKKASFSLKSNSSDKIETKTIPKISSSPSNRCGLSYRANKVDDVAIVSCDEHDIISQPA